MSPKIVAKVDQLMALVDQLETPLAASRAAAAIPYGGPRRQTSLGGTITGEHGVGLAKKPFLKDALGELNLEVMKRIKKSFDSNGILNPWEDFLMNAQHSTLNAQRSSASAVYDLEDRLLEYAVRIIRVAESMKRSAAGVHIADQLLRSGTSPYGNHGETESRDDCIHKLRVCFKELCDSRRWLKLTRRAELVDKPELLEALINESDEFLRIFARSIQTAAKRRKEGKLER